MGPNGGWAMKYFLLSAVALSSFASAAQAQDSDDYRVRAGLGAQLRPKFLGADKTEAAPLFDIDIARGSNNFKFEAPDDGFAIALLSSNGFSFGPAANIAPSRRSKDVGLAVPKVSTTLEAGAFAQYEVADSFRVQGQLLQGLGGHKGIVGKVGADKIWRDGDRYVFSVGPRVLFSNSRFQRAYFGVTPATALATGLPVYRPSSGIHAVGLTSGLSYQFNPRFGMFGFASYDRLVGDAAKSPIVRSKNGSRTQMAAGAGLSYTFTVKR